MKRLLLSLPPNRVRRNYRGGAQLDALEKGARPPTLNGSDPFFEDGDRPEDWIASTIPARNPGLAEIPDEGLARVAAPDGGTVLLKDLFDRYPNHYLGREHVERLGTDLGFLAKLLDSAMRLHVQAHPTAAFARQHLNSRWGKLETYVMLGFRRGVKRYIRLGFQRPPSPAELKRVVLEQDLRALNACFDPIPVRAGEVWVVPGGFPHAIGEGALMLEVMEPTDLVVRCEFEREGIVVPPEGRFMGRDPELALSLFDLTPFTAEDVRDICRVTPRVLRENEGVREEQLIGPDETDCFTVVRQVIHEPVTLATGGQVEVCVVADGSGSVAAGDERIAVRRAAKFLVAAAAERVAYAPDEGQPLVLLVVRPGTDQA